MDVPRRGYGSALGRSSKKSAPLSNPVDLLLSCGTPNGDQPSRSNAPEAKLIKREEVEFDDDVQMDGDWVPYRGNPDSAVTCSSERPDPFELPHPTRKSVSQATIGTLVAAERPVELGGGCKSRREKRRAKVACESDDDDVRVTAPSRTGPDPRHQSKTRNPTSEDDAAIARALQEEEEKIKMTRKKPSKRPTSSSSSSLPSSASAQDDLVARDYEMALRLQQSLDEETAASLQTERTDLVPYGAEGMHYPRSYFATRRRLGPLRKQQLSHYPPMGLGDLGRLHHLYLPHVRRMEDPEDSMSYETLLELEDIPVGMSKHDIASHSSTFTFNLAAAGTSSAQEMCSICLEPFTQGQKLRALPCLHSFHCLCVDRWLSQSKQCPICFKNIQELH